MRARFPAGQQYLFLEQVQQQTGASADVLARQLGVCARTVRDWRRERWQLDAASLERLCRLAGLPQPSVVLLPDYWSVSKASRLGGRRHAELYGSPGTEAGRSKGGRAAQQLFQLDPEYYQLRGVCARKTVKQPSLSADLAEFVGIVLGDRGLTDRQLTIAFNYLDSRYAAYVKRLGEKLFGITPGKAVVPKDHVFYLVFSSTALIDAVESVGLRRGNKVKNQVDIPKWIWRRREYQAACLRGLMDTDGCVYRHRYLVNGKRYIYTKLCFTNYSRPLLLSAKKLFEGFKMYPTLHKDGHRLYLHNNCGVKRYLKTIGTRNPRYLERFNST